MMQRRISKGEVKMKGCRKERKEERLVSVNGKLMEEFSGEGKEKESEGVTNNEQNRRRSSNTVKERRRKNKMKRCWLEGRRKERKGNVRGNARK